MPGAGQAGGPSRKHLAVAQSLKQACEETAAQAINATIQTGQADRVFGKVGEDGKVAMKGKFGSADAARKAKIEAAKAKRAAKEAGGGK